MGQVLTAVLAVQDLRLHVIESNRHVDVGVALI
jgi:hypothetical protein